MRSQLVSNHMHRTLPGIYRKCNYYVAAWFECPTL